MANGAGEGGVHFCCIGRFEFDSELVLTLWSLPVSPEANTPCSDILPHFFLPFQTSKNQIKVELVDENFTELKGEIAGPPDTPYEGERGGYLWSTSVLRDIQASDRNFIFKEGLANRPLQSAVHSK